MGLARARAGRENVKIKNRERLLSAGDIEARTVVLDIVEKSLEALDVSHTIERALRLDRSILRVGNRQWDLRSKRHVVVIGAGKACNVMANAVANKLGDRISKGLVIAKQVEPGNKLKHIELVEGGHPVPSKAGLLASKRILDMVEQATSDDLFIGLVSGGSSALMACPLPGISLEDEIETTRALLHSGARILEINAVRRHVSATNGGRLAQRIEAKGAEMINLIISDVIGDGVRADLRHPVIFFGTPVAPDNTTLQDAIGVIKKYDLRSQLPRSVIEYLDPSDRCRETPKAFGDRIHHFVLQTPAEASTAAKKVAEDAGIATFILTTMLEGESREAGTFLACVAKEIMCNRRPVEPPCVLIASGETTTKVEKASGLGGPSQELCLGFSLEIAGMTGCCLVGLDTDGTDGPTEVAGGIADSTTIERAQDRNMDVYKRLMAHDSHTVLTTLGDAILTESTGTNVCDLNVIYVPER